MRQLKLALLAVPLLALAACDDDGVSVVVPGEAALVRFLNAVPDTGTVDLAFIDQVENLPTLKGVALQSHSGYYQRVNPGSRHARIFPYSTSIDVTSQILVDTTVTLSAPTRYTFVYAGRATNNQDRLVVFEDPAPPTPTQGNIAIQALHVALDVGNVDVYVVPVDSLGAATPADWETSRAAVLTNVGYMSKSNGYATVPALTGTRFYRFVVTAAGSTTPLFSVTPNQPGAAASASAGPQPGFRISGSVLTAALYAGSTAGRRESATANQSPTVRILVDKVLNP